MTESSVLSYEYTDQAAFGCGFCFRGGAAPPRARAPSQHLTASNGHGRRGLTSRGRVVRRWAAAPCQTAIG
jgi:hypothetical protein